MSSFSVPFEVRYARRSDLRKNALHLVAAEDAKGQQKQFFSGTLVRPRHVAELLRLLMTVVQARYHIPAAMLNRILAEADPIVTSSDERLRFEGLSSCCGVYCRVDLFPDAVRDGQFGQGTTNVDFNPPMLAALAKVRESDTIEFVVEREGFELRKATESVVEKKVKLPVRWIRGLTEVQACQSRMTLFHEASGPDIWRFLRSFPRMKTGHREMWIVASGRSLRLSQRATKEGLRVCGLERLRVLEACAATARSVQLFADPVTGASAWQLTFADSRFTLTLSPEVWRGFSGEGQVLHQLAGKSWPAFLRRVKTRLRWQSQLDLADLQKQLGKDVSDETIREALASLATQGLVGFDLGDGAWFHRELPFDLGQVEKHHPRLKDARKLLDEDKVKVVKATEKLAEVLVASSDVEHRVRFQNDEPHCTCPWFSQYQNSRGPCKHILAAQILLEEHHNE